MPNIIASLCIGISQKVKGVQNDSQISHLRSSVKKKKKKRMQSLAAGTHQTKCQRLPDDLSNELVLSREVCLGRITRPKRMARRSKGSGLCRCYILGWSHNSGRKQTKDAPFKTDTNIMSSA